MPSYTAPVKDMQFVLHDVLDVSSTGIPGYDELDRDTTAAILDEAAATIDEQQRAELYAQAQRIVLESFVILPLYDQQNHFLTRDVTGVSVLGTVATPSFIDARLAG